MSERIQAARAALLALIQRYTKPAMLGSQAIERLEAAVQEVQNAAVEAERTALMCEPTSSIIVDESSHVEDVVLSSESTPPESTPPESTPPSKGTKRKPPVSEADHPGDGQPHA